MWGFSLKNWECFNTLTVQHNFLLTRVKQNLRDDVTCL